MSWDNEGDVLAVAVSTDGKSIFSTGIDRRTVAYQLQAPPEFPKRRGWPPVLIKIVGM